MFGIKLIIIAISDDLSTSKILSLNLQLAAILKDWMQKIPDNTNSTNSQKKSQRVILTVFNSLSGNEETVRPLRVAQAVKLRQDQFRTTCAIIGSLEIFPPCLSRGTIIGFSEIGPSPIPISIAALTESRILVKTSLLPKFVSQSFFR